MNVVAIVSFIFIFVFIFRLCGSAAAFVPFLSRSLSPPSRTRKISSSIYRRMLCCMTDVCRKRSITYYFLYYERFYLDRLLFMFALVLDHKKSFFSASLPFCHFHLVCFRNTLFYMIISILEIKYVNICLTTIYSICIICVYSTRTHTPIYMTTWHQIFYPWLCVLNEPFLRKMWQIQPISV